MRADVKLCFPQQQSKLLPVISHTHNGEKEKVGGLWLMVFI